MVNSKSFIKPNMAYLKPLFRLSTLFGIHEQPGTKPKYFKIYSLSMSFTLLIVTIISLYKKIHSQQSNILKYTDITINLCRTGVNVIILFNLKDENVYVTKFQNIIAETDEILSEFYKMNFEKRQRVFYIEMLLIITFLTGSVVIRVYINISIHQITYYYSFKIVHFLVETINKYITTLTVLTFYNFVLLVKDRFYFINSKLIIVDFKRSGGRNLRAFTKCHYLLCEAVECLNDNFGYVLFGMIILISLELIMGVNVIINLIVNFNALHNLSIDSLMLPLVLTSMLFLAFGIMIATSCEQTVQHAFHTTEICYNLSLRYSTMDHISTMLNLKNLLEAISLLAHQACQRKPNFTAAGFFSINFHLLGAMFGTVMSYVIIFVQMK